MSGFLTFLAHHLTAAGFGSGALIVAIISTWPKLRPHTLDDWWEWVRNALQTAIPASRPHPDPPTPPKENP